MSVDLEEISDFLKSQKLENLSALDKLIPELHQRYSLAFIGCGLTRTVFKQKSSRTVIKISVGAQSNRGEYCLFKACDGRKIQTLLADCKGISGCGRILEQEYLYKPIPAKLKNSIFSGSKTWKELVEELESCFSFVKNYTKEKYITYDFHDDNMRVDRNGNVKLIDYSAILSPLFTNKNFSLETCISKLASYTRRHDQRVSFKLNENSLVLETLGNKQQIEI